MAPYGDKVQGMEPPAPPSGPLVPVNQSPLPFSEIVGRVVNVIGEVLLRLAAGVAEAGKRISIGIHSAEVIARRYRWCVSTSWPPVLIFKIAEMTEREAPYCEFEAAMMMFYSANDWYEVEALVEGTCRYESVSAMRRRILRDTVLLIRAAERDGFNGAAFAIPTLFAQLEGILRDYGRESLGLVEGARKRSVTMKDIVPSLRRVATRIERPSLTVITNLLYKSYPSKNPPRGKRFNRHLFNHGRAMEAGRTSYVIRLLLMIDQVAYLIDKARNAESEEVQMRTSWAETLSSSARHGRNSIKTVGSAPWRARAIQLPPEKSSIH